MRKIIVLFLLLATGLVNAADSFKTIQAPVQSAQITYELKLERTKDNVTEIVSQHQSTGLFNSPIPSANFKTVTYLKECNFDFKTKKQKLVKSTVNIGLNTNLIFTDEKLKNNGSAIYKVKFIGDYSELLILPKINDEKCDIETPHIRFWNFTNINVINKNEPIVLADFSYKEYNSLLNKDDDIKYKLTLKVIP
jgi:hypothetical protein